MIKAYIKSSKGNLLTQDETTTLSVILKDGDITLPLDNYNIAWYRVKDGNYLERKTGTYITISANDIDSATQYVCNICNTVNLTDATGNNLLDKSNNVLTADIVLYTSESELFKAVDEDSSIPLNPEDYTFVLANRSEKLLGQIINIDYTSVDIHTNLNSADQITFKIQKTLDDIEEPLWDSIVDLKLIYVVELKEFFEIKVQLDDTSAEVSKTITAEGLCESELSQVLLHNIEINTTDDIARDDYVVTTFYNRANKKGSLLDRVMEKVPNYSIGHIDDTLCGLQRSFSINGKSLYDFLTGECSEQFNCMFIFDSINRTINAYDLYTKCLNAQCGYRGDFNDTCPKCHGTALSYFGEDTTIYIDKENLTDGISFSTDTDSVKNCFKIEGGDDVVTAAIRSVMPNGSDYIYYLSDEQRADMSSELVAKYDAYVKACNDASADYTTANNNLYECMDKVLYYTSELMPTSTQQPETSASEEIKKLTVANLSPLGLASVDKYTSVATVNSALKNYARVYVNTSLFKIDVDDTAENAVTFTFNGKNDKDGYSYGVWTGKLKLTSYSDEKDVAYTGRMNITVYDNYGKFLEQKITKSMAKSNDDANTFDVLAIKDPTKFKNQLMSDPQTPRYCLNRLTSFYDAIQGAIDILVEEDQANEGADWYKDIYLPYYNKLTYCQSAIDAVTGIIKDWENKQAKYEKQIADIQNKLDMKSYFGDRLYKEFCLYRREDVYTNNNFISDGLGNKELLEKVKELVEDASEELYKSAQRKHSISSTLYNLLVMPEFAPIMNHFKLGNWIRINVDGIIYRLRLISCEISFGSLENINVEFSDLTRTKLGYTDIESIQRQASSLATSVSTVSKQAKQGEEAGKAITSVLTNGLNTAATLIKNADSEDIVWGKNGIRLRKYDDITGVYDLKQAALVHNMFAFTRDGWKTAETAIGNITYELNGEKIEDYGVISKSLVSGIMMAGHIYSANFLDKDGKHEGTHFDLNTGSFSVAGDRIKYTRGANVITLKDVAVEFISSDGKTDQRELSKVVTGLDSVVLKVNTVIADYMKVDSFYARFAEIDYAHIKELYADKALVKSLTAEFATISKLEANYINADTINANYLKTQNLMAEVAKLSYADIKKLHADEAFVKTLTAEFASIETLKSDYITAKNIQANYLQTNKLKANIADINLLTATEFSSKSAFIDSLNTMTHTSITGVFGTQFVDNLAANKAIVTDLFGTNFTLAADGNKTAVMNGSALQFKDGDNVYIQLGTDATGDASFFIKSKKGAVIINGDGITKDAIADGLIVNNMIKKKDTTYTGIEGDRLNIDSVISSINGGTQTINVSRLYYDEGKQSLNTLLGTMQKSTTDLSDKVAQNETFQARIETSNGKVLATSNSTTLTCILQKGKEVIDTNGSQYKYSWHRKTASGGRIDLSFNKSAKSITVSYNDIAEDYIYYCDVEDTYFILDASGNQLTDASGNALTAYFPIITAEVTIAKNITEILQTEYYTREETKSSVTTILAKTSIESFNGVETGSILETVNTTKQTVDGFQNTIKNSGYSSTGDFVTQIHDVTSTYSGYTSKVSATEEKADKALLNAKGSENLLRNSDTLDFSGYDFGNYLMDASSAFLTDASGNILMG